MRSVARSSKNRARSLFIAAYLGPALLLYLAFVIVPLGQALQLSMFRWKGLSANKKFIGLDNYVELFHSTDFWHTIRNGGGFLIIGGFIIFTVGLLLAHGAGGKTKGAKFLRSIYLFPQVVSMVVVAILWMFLLNPSYGLVTGTLKGLGLGGIVHEWLSDPKTALPCVILAFVWYALGFYIMLFSAGLESIPGEVKEAAELDGSIGFHRFRTVTWPMLWSIKRVAATYVVINVMNVFAIVKIMTDGGPDGHTQVMLTYLYDQAFTYSRFGYATAVAIANFFVAMLLAGLVMVVMRRDPQAAQR